MLPVQPQQEPVHVLSADPAAAAVCAGVARAVVAAAALLCALLHLQQPLAVPLQERRQRDAGLLVARWLLLLHQDRAAATHKCTVCVGGTRAPAVCGRWPLLPRAAESAAGAAPQNSVVTARCS